MGLLSPVGYAVIGPAVVWIAAVSVILSGARRSSHRAEAPAVEGVAG